MIIPYLAFVILAANAFLNSRVKIVKVILVVFFVAYLLPWTHKGLMEKLKAYNVPSYYFNLAESQKENKSISNKRAIILDSQVSATSYKFDIENLKPLSSNILKFISPLPVVDLFSNGSGVSFEYLKGVFEGLKKDNSDLEKFQKAGITHVYRQGDIINAPEYRYTSAFFNKTSFGKIDIYELKKEYVSPKIFISNFLGREVLDFQKNSPVKYTISIKNISKEINLHFLYTIDDNWKLFAGQKKYDSDQCQQKENYPMSDKNYLGNSGGEKKLGDISISECLDVSNSFAISDLKYLYQKPIFDDTHKIFNEYANQWMIDPEYIKQNFSKDYYNENPDGSIDINLTLYFKPQSYFYLGLIISITTLLGCLGYLGYDLIKRRKRSTTIKGK
ncbi:MAG: hypothetical protein C0412_16090 [Flavobacterium sp.]|nr:hypothetical protein [Flavobacterium sp.]